MRSNYRYLYRGRPVLVMYKWMGGSGLRYRDEDVPLTQRQQYVIKMAEWRRMRKIRHQKQSEQSESEETEYEDSDEASTQQSKQVPSSRDPPKASMKIQSSSVVQVMNSIDYHRTYGNSAARVGMARVVNLFDENRAHQVNQNTGIERTESLPTSKNTPTEKTAARKGPKGYALKYNRVRVVAL
ncbi:unnamed protein product [Allacma fusca]|uniref:Uncharacterized protein n=1 Tax=Allacma fusca TaxID=39272 RepID=A0A8J2K9M8_9HEXA|nr:unnamed protein product [Allacma fusca]